MLIQETYILQFGQNRVNDCWDIADVEFPVGGRGWWVVVVVVVV